MELENEEKELWGLVLAGGRSRRMGREKADLLYEGRTQLSRIIRLASQICAEVYVSLRKDQAPPAEFVEFDVKPLFDLAPGAGPLAGILTALKMHPDRPWLVLAVDLPFLDLDTIRYLLNNRMPSRRFTAFRNRRDGLPEPLCAIYEPNSLEVLLDYVENRNVLSPREILYKSDAHLLDQPNPYALDNVNTEEEYLEALKRIRMKE